MQGFQVQGVCELVLDLCYNGGGYFYIVSELVMMIVGIMCIVGQVFEMLQYSVKCSGDNERMFFFDIFCILVGNSCMKLQLLLMLDLVWVYVLVQLGICLVSEVVVNGLCGVGVDVVLVGGKICGKFYGFMVKDNCGISYFFIEFVGVNVQGFGDYVDGFEFIVGGIVGMCFVKGCIVVDDIGYVFGDFVEVMFVMVFGYVDIGSCLVLLGVVVVIVCVWVVVCGDGVLLLFKCNLLCSNCILLLC